MCFRDRPFGEIVTAAAANGFRAVGLTVGQCLSALERGISFADQAALLTEAGLTVAELELVRLGEDGAIAHANEMVVELSHVLRPERVHTAAFSGDAARIDAEFSALCKRLDPVPVAVEFMPYSRVVDLRQAVELVAGSGAKNARVVLDVLHFFRSGWRAADITAELLEKCAVLQLSDVVYRRGVDLATEARHMRTYPGFGTLDIEGLLTAIGGTGTALPPLSVEPLSDALELLPLAVVAEQTAFSTLSILHRSGWTADDAGFTFQGNSSRSTDDSERRQR